jgi:hypothetical protein
VGGNRSAAAIGEIKAAISLYLRRQPQAADTSDGISRWWLPAGKWSLDEVEEALSQLAAEGRLVRTDSGAGIIWREA